MTAWDTYDLTDRDVRVLRNLGPEMTAAAQTFTVPFAFKDRVHIDGEKSIRAVVTGFAAYPHGQEVRVEWFSNGDAKVAWFWPSRLTLADE